MKPEIIYAKIRKGKSGRFRPLREGEVIEPGDIFFFSAMTDYVSDSAAGTKAVRNDTIIRLEFDK